MSERQSARERLRELAASLNVSFDDIVGQLPSMAKPVEPAPPSTSRITLSDAAMLAAINDSYSVPEIEAASSERELLDQSQLIFVGGRRRLRLTDAARGAILGEAVGTERFETLLKQAIDADRQTPLPAQDEVHARSACLRRFLSGEIGDLASLPPRELRAAVAALERLRDAPLKADLPSLGDAQRLLERAELLEPLRISIGATGPWDRTPTHDRFVGRDRELRLLRSFVDEIASESGLESIQRGFARAGEAIRRRIGDTKVEGVRFLIALGGLGKSALVAKFVLDHALRQARPFPFAYLDFDRAAIQARDARQLLLEVARQIALQFPSVGKELGDLREGIRQSIAGSSATTTKDPFDEFRQLVRARVTHGSRALLIVLDTVEIVQSDPRSLSGLVAFLDRLSRGGFTELRIVAAGRAEVPELLADTPSRHQGVAIRLHPLSHTEAREMVQRLGQSLLGSAWKDEWTARLVGKISDPSERREPLSIRVAVEMLRDERPEKRDARAIEIERLGENAGESFVGKLYEHRVIGHVAGGNDVRKVAWPGLVVRRVSVDVIRDLLAPRLGVDPSRAQALFDALATQVWIVARDGGTLKHQQDLRARTLPLMRRKPEFNEINAAAIEYFAARRTQSEQNRAEWLYHRLLGNESPTAVDRDWDDALIPFLKDAQGDFPSGLPAADYLAARTSDQLLPDELLRRLSPQLTLLHLGRTGLEKGSFADRTLDPLLVSLPITSIPTSSLTPAARAARVCLLVKTGRWTELDRDDSTSGEGPWQEQAAAAIAYHRARRVLVAAADQNIPAAYSGAGSIERASLASLIQDLAASRIRRLPIAFQLDTAVARRLERGVSTTDSTIALPMLRTAMLFGLRATAPATRLWTVQTTEQFRTSGQLAFSAAELRAVSGDSELQPILRAVLESIESSWTEIVTLSRGHGARKRFADARFVEPVCEALRRQSERPGPEGLNVVRAFAAARDEDWLAPLAYAADRATGGRVPYEVSKFFESHDPGATTFLQRNVFSRTPVPTDVLEVLTRADEASDVASAARLFAREGDPKTAADIEHLLTLYDRWREAIHQLFDSPLDSPKDAGVEA